ncbi:hypothetical protein [Christiangramia sp. SM2212]|uniref:Class I SAM-dependent methyltransferase n=1 Tax=Christiangramia sediminicola TaxID=3073267 RepID=A0ABU1ENU8_9FLAO|nr:hypothetical protein [Christiangramia sp. SM2212]MDR5589712.1 hypothetical protein [Christiangramia sp. SM2212]
MRKIYHIFLNQIKKFRESKKYRRQAKKTFELRKAKLSDLDRWKQPEELYIEWNNRTAILASMINPGSNIIEFGAGNMDIKNSLPENCTYTPSDICKRSEDMLICDLNHQIEFNLEPYNTAIFSGVLEYVYDVDKVFRQISKSIDHVVLSYACSDICKNDRLRSGWLSDYAKNELEIIYEKYNYELVGYDEWRNQSIFNLRKLKE